MPTKLSEWWSRLKDTYHSFRASKNFRLIATLVLVLAVPLTVVLALSINDIRQRASGPATPATPPGPISEKHPISFTTPQVSLMADDFYIMADGKKYVANVTPIDVHSDPGSASYTTLEVTWHENGAEMRLYMYFDHKPADFWRVTEIRTYNGQNPGDWIYYQGFIGNELGDSLILPSLDLVSDSTNPDNKYQGSIHFENIHLQAFMSIITPSPSPIATPTPSKRPTATPVLRLSRLTLKQLCYLDANILRWEVSNPNSRDVLFSYKLTGITKKREIINGTAVVPPKGKKVLETARYKLLNLMVIYVGSSAQAALSQSRPVKCK